MLTDVDTLKLDVLMLVLVEVDTLLDTLVLVEVDTLVVVDWDTLELNEVDVEILVLALEYVE